MQLNEAVKQAETLLSLSSIRRSKEPIAIPKSCLERAKELGLETFLGEALAKAEVAVIGNTTAAELDRLGVRADVMDEMPEEFTFEALLQALQGRHR